MRGWGLEVGSLLTKVGFSREIRVVRVATSTTCTPGPWSWKSLCAVGGLRVIWTGGAGR